MKKQKEEFLEPFLRRLRINQIKKFIPRGILVDMGCGRNYIFLEFIKNKIKKGFGFDIEIKRRIKKENIELRHHNARGRLPLKPGFADAVTLLAVIEHISNYNFIISEAKRILKRKGLIIITTPTKFAKYVLEFLSYKLKIVSPKEIQDHKQYFGKKELNLLLEKQGFKILRSNYFEFGLNMVVIAEKI